MNKEKLIEKLAYNLGLSALENKQDNIKLFEQIIADVKQLDESKVEECEFKKIFLLEQCYCYCSNCGKMLTLKTFIIIKANYCPNCGKKIKK